MTKTIMFRWSIYNSNKTWKDWEEKFTKKFKSSLLGAFINNVLDSPGGWGQGVTLHEVTQQTKPWPYWLVFSLFCFLKSIYRWGGVDGGKHWAEILALSQFPCFPSVAQSRHDLSTVHAGGFSRSVSNLKLVISKLTKYMVSRYCLLAEFS